MVLHPVEDINTFHYNLIEQINFGPIIVISTLLADKTEESLAVVVVVVVRGPTTL